jgi:hypothetical protein
LLGLAIFYLPESSCRAKGHGEEDQKHDDIESNKVYRTENKMKGIVVKLQNSPIFIVQPVLCFAKATGVGVLIVSTLKCSNSWPLYVKPPELA